MIFGFLNPHETTKAADIPNVGFSLFVLRLKKKEETTTLQKFREDIFNAPTGALNRISSIATKQ